MTKATKTANVMAKVSQETRDRLERVREKCGFNSGYEIMQYLISAFLRVADPEGEKGPGMEAERLMELATMFEGFESRRTRLVTSAPSSTAERKLRSLVAVFDVAGRRRRDVYRVRMREDGGVVSEYGADKALAGVLRDIAPDSWSTLAEAQQLLGRPAAATLSQALRDSTERWREWANAGEIAQSFRGYEDDSAPRYGERTKRKHHKSPDNL